MSQWDKLIARICGLARDLRFVEIKKVLEAYGYTMKYPSSGSSHVSFRKPGCATITVPNDDPIKRVYVERVRDVVEGKEGANDDT